MALRAGARHESGVCLERQAEPIKARSRIEPTSAFMEAGVRTVIGSPSRAPRAGTGYHRIMNLEGRTALVTAASRGIGRAIAVRLASQGAAVAVNYHDRATEAESVVALIHQGSGRAQAVQGDVGDALQAHAMAECVERELGPIDILVNNAGVLAKGDLADFDYTKMEAMRRTNVDGLVHVTRAVVDGMKLRGFGRIVNLTSVAAHGTALSGTTFYAATKAAVITLTRRFALELGLHGITVNAVAPGFIPTDMATGGSSPAEAQAAIEAMAARSMVRRSGSPEDIANAVAFLVSPESGFITAQTLTVDGGRMDYIAHP
jgi:3-oxoacyl-[acyl-carrier protein] reductase